MPEQGRASGPNVLALPAGVPLRATGPAHPAAIRVIQGWLRALRTGDLLRAAHYLALPSKFQDGTPVLTASTERQRLAVALALRCSGRAIEMGANGRYTIVTFRLASGGGCAAPPGTTARGALRVSGGKIHEWYRLPDDPGARREAPPAPSGPEA